MPDRDIFQHLPKHLRPMARVILAANQAKRFDLLIAAEGFDRLFEGGVASLPKALKYFRERTGDGQQIRFHHDSFANADRMALLELHKSYGCSHLDALLVEEIANSLTDDVRNEHTLLWRFALRTLYSQVVDSKGGVRDQLERKGMHLDVRQIGRHLLPVIEAVAAQMSHNPKFRRLGLAKQFRQPVDPFMENLLG